MRKIRLFFLGQVILGTKSPILGDSGGCGAPTTKAAAAELSNTYLLTLTKRNIMQFGL